MEINRSGIRKGACALLVLALATAAHATGVSIAAIVNDAVITTTDLNDRRDLLMATNNIPNTIENQQKIAPRVMQSLVDEALQLQEAKRLSLSVTDEEVENAINSMTTNQTGAGLRDFVRSNKLSERSLANQMRAQIAWGKVVQRKIRRNVNIAQDEVQRAQKADASAPGEQQLRLAMIEVKKSDKPGNEKLAEEIALQLKAGAEITSVAARYMKQPEVHFTPPTWVAESGMPGPLQQVLRGLKDGEATPPLRNPNGAQIIQLFERRTTPKLADTTEYVLKQISLDMPKKQEKAAMQRLRDAVSKLRSNPGSCDTEDAAKVDLPTEVKFARVQLGALSPEQRALLSRLEVGQVSEPLPSADHLRLIMVCEKTEPASGGVADAERIRQQLFTEKLELEAQKYMRNLRRDAFIDIKGMKQ